MTTSAPLLAMSETMFYVTTLVADRPRAIDKVIDYFGDPPRTAAARELDSGLCSQHEQVAVGVAPDEGVL